ncbi:amidohydrolase [Paraflavitalea soli]|uniref:Amidohydrolase n=1 Tax=Paraflavitalea soli TaxID=2315862 RepID=A0A3B7MJK5_9BACT|nr:amidohydrolase family protein [Paraflavitalea soli]AXY74634.1 amidohydrolase [Paraflavitalea soli]
MKKISTWIVLSLLVQHLFAQKKPLPVIDMHVHALHADDQGPAPISVGAPFRDLGLHDPANDYRKAFMQALKTRSWADHSLTSPLTDDSMRILTLAALEKNNVYAVTSGEIETVRQWKQAAPKRIINSVDWTFGLAAKAGLTVDSLEKLFRSGEFKVFGEISIQYEGISPSDSAFEPYLAMAERLDIPVAIHVGNGPPGAPYIGAVNYRARLHSAFVLEEALLRHPKLRVYAMHAGWPLLDDMLATLFTHPQLYVDLGAICYMIPTKEFYYYLERLVNAGFGKRILFGSDNMVWPQAIARGIETINKAPFLTAAQKRDILFNNAARFLRLTDQQIKEMH